MRTALCAAVLASLALSAHAALNRASIVGESVISHPVPGNRPAEICVIPQHFADGDYSAKDLEHEKELCALNKNSTAAVCGKLESTNPGLNFYKVKAGQTPQAIAQANCQGAKKIAKYKLSTSCSKMSSILGYYHLSRILGDAGNVPPTVLRTFDLADHVRLGRIAKSRATGTMLETWKSLLTQLEAGANAPKRDLLLTSDFLQSYGALSKNPRKEIKYANPYYPGPDSFFNGGADKNARAARFKANNPVVKLLNKRAPVDTFIPREFKAANVRKLQQMKDASDFIVLDTLMAQEDRFGNIHAEERYYYLDANKQLKSKDARNMQPGEAAQLNGVSAFRILLKDNDCGLRENVVKAAGLPDILGHMNPDMYQRLLKLNQVIGDAAVKKFFTEGLLFSNDDFNKFAGNLRELAKDLHESCKDGKLFLDLDLKNYFNGNTQPVSCDI
jgi:hypothetical protein